MFSPLSVVSLPVQDPVSIFSLCPGLTTRLSCELTQSRLSLSKVPTVCHSTPASTGNWQSPGGSQGQRQAGGEGSPHLKKEGHFYPEPTVTQPGHVTLKCYSNCKAMCYREEFRCQTGLYTLYLSHVSRPSQNSTIIHLLPHMPSWETQQWSYSPQGGVSQVGGGQSVFLLWV